MIGMEDLESQETHQKSFSRDDHRWGVGTSVSRGCCFKPAQEHEGIGMGQEEIPSSDPA